MSAEIVDFTGVTRLDLPVERVLGWAQDANLEQVIVVGVDNDGEFYFASSMGDGADNLWWLSIAKKKLLEIGDHE